MGNDGQSGPIENRLRQINDAGERLLAAILAGEESKIAAPALTLLQCGLIALTEIADAQTRMVAMAELDLGAEISQAVDIAAEEKATDKLKEKTKRSFIGDKG